MKWFLTLCIMLFTVQCSTYRFKDLKRSEKQGDAQKVIQFLDKSIDAYVRAQAAQSAGRMNIKQAIPNLLTALESDDWIVRYYAAKSLSVLNVPSEHYPRLSKKMAEEKNEYVRAQIQKIIGPVPTDPDESKS